MRMHEFPVPEHKYYCPLCGSVHGEYYDADACAKTHAIPKGIVEYDGYDVDREGTNAPRHLLIDLSNGAQAKYILVGVLPAEANSDQREDAA